MERLKSTDGATELTNTENLNPSSQYAESRRSKIDHFLKNHEAKAILFPKIVAKILSAFNDRAQAVKEFLMEDSAEVEKEILKLHKNDKCSNCILLQKQLQEKTEKLNFLELQVSNAAASTLHFPEQLQNSKEVTLKPRITCEGDTFVKSSYAEKFDESVEFELNPDESLMSPSIINSTNFPMQPLVKKWVPQTAVPCRVRKGMEGESRSENVIDDEDEDNDDAKDSDNDNCLSFYINVNEEPLRNGTIDPRIFLATCDIDEIQQTQKSHVFHRGRKKSVLSEVCANMPRKRENSLKKSVEKSDCESLGNAGHSPLANHDKIVGAHDNSHQDDDRTFLDCEHSTVHSMAADTSLSSVPFKGNTPPVFIQKNSCPLLSRVNQASCTVNSPPLKISAEHDAITMEDKGAEDADNSLRARKVSLNKGDGCAKQMTVGSKFLYERVVRKKSEREQMTAFACRDCALYFGDSSQRCQVSCRHRRDFPRPETPEGYWSVDMPPTPVNPISAVPAEKPVRKRRQYALKRKATPT